MPLKIGLSNNISEIQKHLEHYKPGELIYLKRVTENFVCLSVIEKIRLWSSQLEWGFKPNADVTHPKSGVAAMVVYMKQSAHIN